MQDFQLIHHLATLEELGLTQHSILRQILRKALQRARIDLMQKVENVSIVLQPQPLSGEEMEMVTTYVMHVAFITK